MRARLMQPAYYDSSDESDEGGQAAPRDPAGAQRPPGDPTEGGLKAGFLGGAWEPYVSSGVRSWSFRPGCVATIPVLSI